MTAIVGVSGKKNVEKISKENYPLV